MIEIILTDEKDERFINFCQSFESIINTPQTVLLLRNNNKIEGCASFKKLDASYCEITTLFLNSFKNRDKIAFKLIRQLEKVAIDMDLKKIIVTFDSGEGILIDLFDKLDYHIKSSDGEVLMEKDFKRLI